MKAFQILDIKDFMKKLLIQETFDHFRVSDFSVTTGISYSIDGTVHPEFYEEEAAKSLRETGETYIAWEEMKPFCLSVIKGKQTPLNFKIVFLLAKENIKKLLEMNDLSINFDDVFGLYLNCQYENNSLMCVTGTSLRFFSLDKSLEQAWDKMVLKFLGQQEISFEPL